VNSNKCPHTQWYSQQLITSHPFCTSDEFKENNKTLWENNHWYLASMNKNKEDKNEKFHRFLNHISPQILHLCPKGTLSLVCWQLCIATLTLENSHELLDKTHNKNDFKYFKYDWNVQTILYPINNILHRYLVHVGGHLLLNSKV